MKIKTFLGYVREDWEDIFKFRKYASGKNYWLVFPPTSRWKDKKSWNRNMKKVRIIIKEYDGDNLSIPHK